MNELIVDTDFINDKCAEVKEEKKLFKQNSFDPFKKGYVSQCKNRIVVKMHDSLNAALIALDESYDSVISFLEDYPSTVVNMECTLSQRKKMMPEDMTGIERKCVERSNKLPELKTFKTIYEIVRAHV